MSDGMIYCSHAACANYSCKKNPNRIHDNLNSHTYASYKGDPQHCPMALDTGAARKYAWAAQFMRKMRKAQEYGLNLTAQEFRVLKGQATHGDVDGAERGLERMLKERGLKI